MENLDAIHRCHHPTCPIAVPPAMLACKPHWFQLPLAIRNEIWRTYRKGQEVDKSPTREYMAAFQKAQDYWEERLKAKK